jgi:peroxiredoxin
MKKPKILTPLLISGLLLAWVWFSRIPASAQSTQTIEAPKNNFLAPLFTLKTLDEKTVSLEDLRGQPIILNFWASWCPPCRAEMPDFQEAWQEYGGTDLIIIGINATYQDSLREVNSFVNQNHLEFPILLDPDGRVSGLYNIHSLPTTFIIDQEGIIRKTLIGGPIPLSLLRIEADKLLQEGADVPNN